MAKKKQVDVTDGKITERWLRDVRHAHRALGGGLMRDPHGVTSQLARMRLDKNLGAPMRLSDEVRVRGGRRSRRRTARVWKSA